MEGGGHKKEYSVYALDNIDNIEQPLTVVRAVVFAESADNVTIQRLARDEVTKVFDQAKFEKHLTEFNNGRARQPSSEVVLVIGQKPNNDRSRYLMYVKVTGSKAANQLVSGRHMLAVAMSFRFACPLAVAECQVNVLALTFDVNTDLRSRLSCQGIKTVATYTSCVLVNSHQITLLERDHHMTHFCRFIYAIKFSLWNKCTHYALISPSCIHNWHLVGFGFWKVAKKSSVGEII